MILGKTVLTLIGVGAALYVVGKMAGPPEEPPRKTVIPDSILREMAAASALKIVKMSWHKGGFGSVAVADFQISNGGDVAVKDVTIECQFSAESGTALDTRTQTIFKSFPAKKTTAAKDVSLGFINSQVAGAACEIVDLSF